MFSPEYIKEGEQAWEVRMAELLIETPAITVEELADKEAEFWADWYEEEGEGVDADVE
jgi:hypothetical protein